jgi:3',5'-cyclic AMP phosphodiesterase CpdA
MNILHISDLHFGPRHWDGDDGVLLEKINSYASDIVFNTGDSTSDGMESEFKAAGRFLKGIKCKNVFSIIGNHDKRNMSSHELFSKHIQKNKIIYPLRPDNCTKKELFMDRAITRITENFTDINYIKTVSIDDKTILIIGIDSNELYNDNGYVEEEVLNAISDKLYRMTYDECLLLTHHSVLGTDECPLNNSMRVTDFIKKHKIKHIFCGHTHELELRESTDLYQKHTFRQYMGGSLSSCNHSHDVNRFTFFENWGTAKMRIHIIKIFTKGNKLNFENETIKIKQM